MRPYERQLRRAHNAGDANRLLELVEPMCRRLARAYYLPGGDRQDVLQEARIGVAAAFETWRPEGGASLAAFVELCARRRVQTAVKGSLRHCQLMLSGSRRFSDSFGGPQGSDDMLLGEIIPAPMSDPAVLAEQRADLSTVLGALPTLSVVERDALVGIALRGETYDEIAGRRGTSSKSIDNAAQRARRKLRKELAA